MDRCLPAYAIKILERLHHIFYGIDNVIVIISIDRNQLEYSIKQIYGEKVNVDKYLKKFIDFSLKLDNGEINKNFKENIMNIFVSSKIYKVMNKNFLMNFLIHYLMEWI